jgi:hypothetical protein
MNGPWLAVTVVERARMEARTIDLSGAIVVGRELMKLLRDGRSLVD